MSLSMICLDGSWFNMILVSSFLSTLSGEETAAGAGVVVWVFNQFFGGIGKHGVKGEKGKELFQLKIVL